jgi:hypothetical protein
MKVENSWPNSGTGSAATALGLFSTNSQTGLLYAIPRKSGSFVRQIKREQKKQSKNNQPAHDRTDQIIVFGQEFCIFCVFLTPAN